jgi:hypothetical protein
MVRGFLLLAEPPAGGRLSYLDLDPGLMASQNAKSTLSAQTDPGSACLEGLFRMGIPELDRGVTPTVTKSVPFTVAGNKDA